MIDYIADLTLKMAIVIFFALVLLTLCALSLGVVMAIFKMFGA